MPKRITEAQMKIVDFGYFKYVRLNHIDDPVPEFRFIEVTLVQTHTDLVDDSEKHLVTSAGSIFVGTKHWKFSEYGSQSLKVKSLDSDPSQLTEILGRPQGRPGS